LAGSSSRARIARGVWKLVLDEGVDVSSGTTELTLNLFANVAISGPGRRYPFRDPSRRESDSISARCAEYATCWGVWPTVE